VSIRKAMMTGMVGAAALLPLRAAWATDLKLSLGAAGEYDSNIFHRESHIEDDFVVIGIPQLELLDTEGKFTYDAGYSFPYQHSIKTNALRDFNHVANLSMDYHQSDQTQFSFSNQFSYLNALSNSFDQTPNIADNEERHRITRNDATFGVTHLFSPRLQSETSIDQEVFSTTQEDRSDNQTYSASTGLTYLVTERQRAGGGVSFSYLNFDEATDQLNSLQTQDIPKSHSIFVGPFLEWRYLLDEQSQLRVSGGPTYVTSHQASTVTRCAVDIPGTCNQGDVVPPVQESASDSRWAFLGDFTLDRHWSPTLVSAVGYTRRQDTASGVSGSAILDAVFLTNAWNITDTWTLGLRGDWTSRKGATNLDRQGVDDLDTQRWGAGTVLSKQITRNFSGSLRYQYAKQTSAGNSAGSRSDFDAHIVTLGFNYSLDPIKVW
jgi:hypothetical protein